MAVAKRSGTAVLLVGHVTKEGALAGPRVLEHLVDCVLQFEGERERTYRTLRALKNRFGSTNDVGVFEMRDGGLVEVLDASARFVGEATRAPGSVVLAAMEGSRPLLVEVQALVSPSELVPPRRVCNGIDRNRLALVLAVLGRHAGVGAGTRRRLRQRRRRRADRRARRRPRGRAGRRQRRARRSRPAATADAPLACFGEIGLTGELRSVAHPDRRSRRRRSSGSARSSRPTARRRCATRCATRWAPSRRGARPEAARRIAPPRRAGAPSGAARQPSEITKTLVEWASMAQRSGDELTELESRQEPRLVKALEMVAPGTALREGIDNILHARTGGLIVIGDPEELSFLFSGGIKLDIDYTPAFLYQVAKMDGAIVLNANATKIPMANVQLMPDPTILSLETGTRHRTAERVSKQTDALVIAISARREVVSLYVDGAKYILEDIPRRAGQGQPGAGDARQVPHAPGPGLDAPHGARVRGRRDAARRPHRAPALRARDAHGRRDRALHRRARHRGPPDRDAARGDDGRHRRRQGRARARLPGRDRRRRVRRRAGPDRAPAAPGPARLRPPRRAARLRPQAQHAGLPVSPRGYRILGRIPRLPKLVVASIVQEFGGLDEMLATPDAELETVEGVGEIRAKDIREGLRRLQEINLVDRYLQT